MDELQRRLESLSPEKRALLEKMRKTKTMQGQARNKALAELPAHALRAPSAVQARLFTDKQLNPQSAATNLTGIAHIEGNLNLKLLYAALLATMQRHEICHSIFEEQRGKLHLKPHASFALPFSHIDLRQLDPATAQQTADTLIAKAARKPHRLNKLPLAFRLLQLEQTRFTLIITADHAFLDQFSLTLFLNEALQHLKDTPPTEKVKPFAAFAEWQRARLNQLLGSRQYWLENLGDLPGALPVPHDLPTPSERHHHTQRLPFQIPKATLDELYQLAQEMETTLFAVLLAAWATLLQRYSGHEDFAVGVPHAGRPLTETQTMLGPYVNMLPIRVEPKPSMPFSDFVEDCHDALKDAYRHNELSYDTIVAALAHQRQQHVGSLFQTAFLPQPPMPKLQLENLQLSFEFPEQGAASFDLAVYLFDEKTGRCALEFDIEAIEKTTAQRMRDAYLALLDAIAADPDLQNATFRLSQDQSNHTAFATGQTTRSIHGEVLIHALDTPQQIAIYDHSQSWTFGELAARAAGISNMLTLAKPETCIGIALPRSAEAIACALGVMNAGCIFVFLDPDLPGGRLSEMVRISNIRTIIAEEPLPLDDDLTIEIWTSDDWQTTATLESIGHIRDNQHLAYLIFTSGSTGTPKAVAGTHRGMVNRIRWFHKSYPYKDSDIQAHRTPLNFIDALHEMFVPLAAGVPLFILDDETSIDPVRLVETFIAHDISILITVPALLSEIAAHLREHNRIPPRLRLIISSGEALPPNLAASIRARLPRVRLLNLYGSSEVTADATVFEVSAPPRDTVPIGHPLANFLPLLLNADLTPTAAGFPGELYIAGHGLARGYFARPDLTAERFLPNPFTDEVGARMYRTGDLARLDAHDQLRYLGRCDRQLKLRGVRIEPSEIERRLESHETIGGAAIALNAPESGDPQLVAYVEAKPGQKVPDDRTLRQFLARHVPQVMLPTWIVRLDHLPRTPHGKLNRRALPTLTWTSILREESTSAEFGENENIIADIWNEVLGQRPPTPQTSFFQMGGHSLAAIRIAARLEDRFYQRIRPRELFVYDTPASLAALFEHKPSTVDARVSIPKTKQQSSYPLSPAQTRLWIDASLYGSNAYHIHWALQWHGLLNLEALEASLQALIKRHEALRTRLLMPKDHDEAPRAATEESIAPQLQVLNISDSQQVAEAITTHTSANFAMDTAPLWRILIVSQSQEHHVISMTLHHQIADGWSLAILQEEWLTLYTQFIDVQPIHLPAIEGRYADFAIWQRQDTNNARRERDRRWWRIALEGAPPLLDLCLAKTRQSLQKTTQAAAHMQLSESLSDEVRRIARAYRTTPFTILLTGFKLLLFHHSHQDDIVVGTATANRPNQAFERVIGFFANLLPLRTDMSDHPTFSLLLTRIQENFNAVENHSSLTFDSLVATLNPARSAVCHPIFQALFLYEGINLIRTPNGTSVEAYDLQMPRTPYDLTLAVTDYGGAMRLRWQYRRDWLDAPIATRIFQHYIKILSAALAAPEKSIHDLLPEDRISQSWGRRSYIWSRHADLPHAISRFEMMARSQPDAAALIDAAGSQAHYSGEWMHTWRYGEINSLANRIAFGLQQRDVTPGQIIAVCLPRSAETVASMLAILKCGATFLPLDPVWPVQRIRDLLNDSHANLLLCSEAKQDLYHNFGVPLATLSALAREAPESWQTKPMPGSAASHVLYTSGSSGKPKGVVLTHDNLKSFYAWAARGMPAGSRTCVLAGTSFTFDLSIYEIFATLDLGGTLILVDSTLDLPMLPPNLRSRVSLINTVPSVMRELLRTLPDLPELRAINLAGETFPADLAQTLRTRFPKARITNLYGPTETSVYATSHAVYGKLEQDPAIGKSLPHTRASIVGQHLQPMPRNVPGQIAIAGHGLARGYLNRADLTANAFRPDPSGPHGSRLYLSGDLGVWDESGNVHFLGRLDHQVKHRGFRIEPGEIEAALRRHVGIRDAAVVLRGRGEKAKLCAYLVTHESNKPEESNLRDHLKHLLPVYMSPQHFIFVEALPLTLQGKLDWRALPDPAMQVTKKIIVKPGTPMQMRLAEIFAKLLEQAPIHEDTNFFDAGGHSLLAVQLLARANREFRTNLSLRDLFEAPTPRLLGDRVAAQWDTPDEVPPPVLPFGKTQADYPLSYPQEHLWYLSQLDPKSSAYHLNFAVSIEGKLQPDLLLQSLKAVVGRHDVMRASFVTRDGEPSMVIADDLQVEMQQQDFSDLEQLKQTLVDETRRPFNLAQAPLFRITLFKQSDEVHVLLMVLHHIVGDAWSSHILWREVVAHYEALLGTHRLAFNDLPIQYQDFARWQRQWLQGNILERRINYWRKALVDMPMRTDLPFDRLKRPVHGEAAARVPIHIPADTAHRLRELGKTNGSTLFLTLLSAFLILLYRYTGQRDLAIGVPMAGRLMAEVENLVGYFVNLVIMRVKIHNDSHFHDIHKQLQDWMLDIHRYRDLPFEKVVETIAPQRQLDVDPLIQVVFSHRNMPLPLPSASQIKVTHLEVPNHQAKYDLLVDLEETQAGLKGYFEYRTSRFDHDSMVSWAHHFKTLLHAILQHASAPVGALPILTKDELQQLRGAFDANRTDYMADDGLFGAFAAQANLHSDRVAVMDGSINGSQANQRYTYREALESSGRIALALQACELQLEEMVALAIPRSALTVLGKLGILQAGGAYLPLDLELPPERMHHILKQANIRVVLCARQNYDRFGDYTAIAIEDALTSDVGVSSMRYVDADQLAYTMFTSGSTGTPKAVGISHRGVMRLVLGGELFQPKPERVFLHHSPTAFDASTFEIWGALLTGACVVVAPLDQLTPQQYGQLIRDHHVDVAWLTSALFSLIAEEHPSAFEPLKLLFAGGDVLAPQHCRVAFQNMPQGTLVNGYGPTENTTFSCCFPIYDVPASDQAVPIGRPIGNTTAYVLDQDMYPLPKGAWGTLYVGGDGLARGYLGNPRMTAEVFLPHPFAARPGRRLYNTGDRARFDREGYIMFGGRHDHQVKIRGFRVELGEVESALRNAPGVADLVIVSSGSGNNKSLIAYLKPEPGESLNETAIRRYAYEHLPNYMIPEQLCQIDQIPLSATGKVDRRRLPLPEQTCIGGAGPAFIAPQTHTERGLAEIWSELLEINTPGLEDNFFEVGGNSLLAVRLFSEIEKRFRKRLPIAALLEAPTLGSLAKRLAQTAMSHPIGLVVPLRSEGPKLPLYLVHSLGGDVLIYHRLVKYLQPDRPVFGLQLQGLDGQEVHHSSIQEIAKSYVDRLRQIQPKGPYAIAGFCTGGVIAHEMACQIERQGQEVAFLGLVESIPFNLIKPFPWYYPPHLFMFLRNIVRWLLAGIGQPPTQVAAVMRNKFRRLKGIVRGALGQNLKTGLRIEDLLYEDVSHFPDFRLELMKIHYQELIQFVPDQFAGQADLFRLKRQPLLSRPSKGLGWEQLVAAFDTYHLDGSHITLLDDPYVQTLATQMDIALEKRTKPE